MKSMIQDFLTFQSNKKISLFTALRTRWAEGYTRAHLKADILAGTVVGLVALPLSMALAIASGVKPQNGIYTAIVAGILVALMGGSRCQVTGPTAAFVVILAPIVHKFGPGGLMVAGFLAGAILFFMGVMKLGRLIEFVPHPVTTGFTSGIALVIAIIQLKDFLGLTLAGTPESFFQRIQFLWEARHTFSWIEFSIGMTTLGLLVWWPKFNRKIPAPLFALGAVTAVAYVAQSLFPQIQVATIGNKFSTMINGVEVKGIPQLPPLPVWPLSFGDAQGNPLALNFSLIQALLPSAFAIAMLGAIESLLSAVVSDAMSGTRHDPDSELSALGIANMICPFFGGIAATGAISRTATNIRYGATSPFAAVTQGVFILLVVVLLAPVVSHLPMASLAALLILVSYNMADLKHFKHILQVAPRNDILVLMVCFTFTVLFDMVIGVGIGVTLATLLFIQRMAEITEARLHTPGQLHPEHNVRIPADTLLYEIEGPLFFGAAERATRALGTTHQQIKKVIFDLDRVLIIDVSGLVALESAFIRLSDKKIKVAFLSAHDQPEELIRKSKVFEHPMNGGLYKNLQEALDKLA